MKNKITAILLISVLTFSCLSGCKDRANTAKVPKTGNEEIKPQLVVAANPSLVLDGRNSVIAFNDVKNAMAADQRPQPLLRFMLKPIGLWFIRPVRIGKSTESTI